MITTTDRYEFYSNFWINLHHFLYNKAKQSNERSWKEVFDARLLARMNQEEREVLGYAIDHYRGYWIDKSLLSDDQLYWVKRALIKFGVDDELDHEAIDPQLQEVLNETKEIYEDYFWKDHDKQNRRIVESHLSLIEIIENQAFARIAALAQKRWPDEKVRADVSYYANWAGAYCTITPIHAVVTSQIEGPEGSWPKYGWLELVFHEPSHALIYPGKYAVGTGIQEVSHELGVEELPDLWHAVLFYFAGVVIQELLATEGMEHELLMVTNDIFSRYHSAVLGHMPAYVSGDESLEESLQKTVESLND